MTEIKIKNPQYTDLDNIEIKEDFEKNNDMAEESENYRENDPLGSYTGSCEHEDEAPIQDADDL